LERFYSGDVRFIYQDASVKEAGNHAGLSYLERIIPKDMRNRVYFVHLEENARDKILEKGFQVPELKGKSA